MFDGSKPRSAKIDLPFSICNGGDFFSIVRGVFKIEYGKDYQIIAWIWISRHHPRVLELPNDWKILARVDSGKVVVICFEDEHIGAVGNEGELNLKLDIL